MRRLAARRLPLASVRFPLDESRLPNTFSFARSSLCKPQQSSSLSYKTHRFSSLATDEDDVGNSKPTKTIPFILADIGEGIAEVELLQWFVSPGDHVSQFDRICEVQSDKATVEITSRYDGEIESLTGHEGEMIRVGSPLCHIRVEDSGGSSSVNPDKNSTNQKSSAPTASATLNNVDDEEDKLQIPSLASKFQLENDEGTKRAKVLTTPAVRKIGMEHNLDLSNIVGTGPKGRVLKADVLKIIHDKEGPPAAAPVPTSAAAAPAKKVVTILEEDTTVDIKGYNRLMVKSMTSSLQVPHMCYGDEINMNEILKCRKEIQKLAESHGVAKLSLLPFAIKAVSLALKDYPVLNATLDAGQYKVTYKANHNIGVAMDTPRGLAVPVVKACQNLSVLEIAVELERLRKLGMESSLSEEDISGATFTISNMGAIGGTYMGPVVVPPQVAIGAMGRIQRLPRFVGDEVEAVNIMQISWGGDHRIIDGATLARFSNQWKDYMESPVSMIVSMK